MKPSRIVLGCIFASFGFLAGGADAQVVTQFGAGITASQMDITAGPNGKITAGPNGKLWFTDALGEWIGRIPRLGVVTESFW